MKRLGKRGRKWETTRRKLKQIFESKFITTCEICGNDNGLSFAHRKKRRFITDDDELLTVALLCLNCHDRIEKLTHSEMFKEITELIEKRMS